MDDLLERFAGAIDANATLSLTASDLESVIDSDATSVHEDQPYGEGAAQRSTDTPLTDDAVGIRDEWLDSDQLHTINDEIVTEHVDSILILLIAAGGGRVRQRTVTRYSAIVWDGPESRHSVSALS